MAAAGPASRRAGPSQGGRHVQDGEIVNGGSETRVLALCGGVGGAKLALGLYRTLTPGALTVAINTGDDFEHLGLHVSPDIDTVTYTLSGLSDTERGWGLAEESWRFMSALERLGGETWFRLGDLDLATHVERTRRLRAGETLSEITAGFAARLGIRARLIPMSDDPVRTMVQTPQGELGFQSYFVGRQCEPEVRAISFKGAENARVHPALIESLADPTLAAIIICPSNPYLSVDPILAVDGVRDALLARGVPCIAISPLVGGKALKGPLTKLIGELGKASDNRSIAEHYRGLVDHLVIDECDAADAEDLRGTGLSVTVTQTVMREAEDRERLAREVLAAAGFETD
ncbi:MAG: 2-phospho-L-lactate transferase [Alphaproteobacteria bacterium]|nr:2-phospho-L-lactate transferase [Alphaproteobacteria bacterium]